MGRILTPISFWTVDFPIDEVVSASTMEYFKLTNLKSLAKRKFSLGKWDNGNFQVSFRDNGDFIEFKPGEVK